MLIFENQKITLYANKKKHPFRDGYMITQIKRSILLDICKLFNIEIRSDLHGNFPILCHRYVNLIFI